MRYWFPAARGDDRASQHITTKDLGTALARYAKLCESGWERQYIEKGSGNAAGDCGNLRKCTESDRRQRQLAHRFAGLK